MIIKAVGLIERFVERMKLINGPDENCCLTPIQCPNHALIHEAEAFLNSVEHKDSCTCCRCERVREVTSL